ncbi:ATP-dependent RNA helicase HrpA [Pendulispora albinea]|uniref:ATP-dependent RNA helicase HrpA n=1 Tax=Pendulispora albinea TaxID=2741071 RepID=A0ABZ2LWJ6_9BACT
MSTDSPVHDEQDEHQPRGSSPIQFPPELPISARVSDIATAIHEHQVVIVAGATGSGKTTQLPKIALAMGRGLELRIGVTQPRRIAATSVAARVASELGSPLGTDVGYQIRFEDRTSPRTYVKFMTDGILLAEIQGDPLLRHYDTLVIDEAHERSLTIDFLLGWLKRLLPQRPDLKVIVSSATLETERFSEFFGGAPVIQVEGRTYPVDVLYEPPPDDVDLPEAVANAVANVTSLDPRGDILVFLPGEREIRETENELLARDLRHTVVQPLYARLSAAEQAKVFASIPQRRVILATNVAETSLTIPGIVYVIDAGLARLSRYEPRSGTTRLQIEAISQASADQRKGRCGRVREGICVRLYDEQSFAARPAFTDPEIKRTGLAGVILRMKALGLGDVEDFPFLDPPQPKAIAEGYRVLEELGALGPKRDLTPLGERLARFPVDPRIGRMILAGSELGCLREVLVIAAALNIQDPRERPRDAQQKADEQHRKFRDERSDFVGLLRLWDFVREAERKGKSHLRRVCKESFLSFLRIREWGEIHRQLTEVVRDMRIPAEAGAKTAQANDEALHRALVTGLLSKIGMWHPENRIYMGAKQTRFAIHPSSSLAKKAPAWIMAFELVETTQLFARTAAKIEPDWLLDAAPHLLKRSYSDPHWSEKSARASVREHATLFGLPVARDRSVDYASVAPAEARRMFLEHALVRGEYKTKGAFQQKNGELLAEVARLRDKARRSDMLADDDALLEFFDRRVPENVVNGKTFEAWREQAEKADPKLLLLSLDDVLQGEQNLSPKDYPERISLHGATLAVTYRFDPSADDDGITLTVPLVLLPQLAPGELDWTIPGWHQEKLAALLYELPRSIRRDLGEIPELARALASRTKPFSGPMIPTLTRAIADITGVDVPEDAFRPDMVAAYLRLTCRVVGEDGKVVAQSRNVDDLLKQHGAQARAVWQKAAPSLTWERKGLTTWDFSELPPFIVQRVAKTEIRSYPALVDRGSSVDRVLLESSVAAEAASRAGIRRLFVLGAKGAISSIAPRIPPAFARPNGALTSRAENETFREMTLMRIVDMAFGLGEDTPLPHQKNEFERMLAAGAPRVAPVFRLFADAIAAVASELDKTLRALKTASKHPSGRAAIVDIYAQLEHLFPVDLMASITLPRLEHFPRYLRAAQARLGRAVTDPRKDTDKLAPFAPLWSSFLAKRASARDPLAVRELRWAFEELRVAIFAPELKTAVPVSIAKVSAALAALRA